MPIPALRAFTSRNYRLYFAGQGLSLLGTWMQKTAVSWVVYAITQSKVMLGVTVFATLFPSALFTPIGGVISDRYNRFRVLLATQVLSMMQAIGLTLVVLGHHFVVPIIIALSAILGIINAFDVPARQALVYDMVDDKANLPNALALNSSMVNLSKFIGPAAAGILIEKLGDAVCFGLNAASFIAVILSLMMMKLPPYVRKAREKNIVGELREGFAYIRATPSIRYIIIMLGAVSLTVLPFTSLMPVFAKDIFRGTASTFGMIDSAVGLGAFAGAIFLASLKPETDLARILTINTFVFGAGLMLFSFMPWYWPALVAIAIGAFGMMSQVTVNMTLIQTTVAPQMRGRVISVFVMAWAGLLPLGSLLVTAISQHIGPRETVFCEGVIALLIGCVHLRTLRRVRKKSEGIMEPENMLPDAALEA